jgi:pimeloyl-ACP methyl ester carboxylesterase
MKHRSTRLVAIGTMVVVLIGPFLWNLAITEWLAWRNPPPGQLYLVEGNQMHLYCLGDGPETIVIESGMGDDWLGWQRLQPRLSEVTRTCTYDRLGHGWSAPRSDSGDAVTIARQLKGLMDQAAVRAPFILMAHSAGGLYARVFVGRYSTDVSGLVLLDSSYPEQVDELPGFRASYESGKKRRTSEILSRRIRIWSGWDRMLGHCRSNPPKDLEYLEPYFAAKRCRPDYIIGNLPEYLAFETSAKQAAEIAGIGKIPLLIVSEDPARQGMTADDIAEQPIWSREQERLKTLSPLSWRVIARGAAHAVADDRPDLIVQEVKRMIEFLRGAGTPAFGSTTTQ